MELQTIKDVLLEFKEYCAWMYYSKGGIDTFNSLEPIEYKDRKFKIKIIEESGLYEIADLSTNKYCSVLVWAVPNPLREGFGIENYKFERQVSTADSKTLEKFEEEQWKIFSEVSIFALNAFQRTLCFTYFCRMQPETLDGIANDLKTGFDNREKNGK
jgi:hypothetical protein